MIEVKCIELGNNPGLHRDFHFPASNCVRVEFEGIALHVLTVNVPAESHLVEKRTCELDSKPNGSRHSAEENVA